MTIIKFSEEQSDDDFGLDDSITKYNHAWVSSADYTLCGQAIAEYDYAVVDNIVTCPECINIIKGCKNIAYKNKKRR